MDLGLGFVGHSDFLTLAVVVMQVEVVVATWRIHILFVFVGMFQDFIIL